MSIEEIIHDLSSLAQRKRAENAIVPDGFPVDSQLVQEERLLREAIAMLRTHQESQPNEPLTLEELREIDGVVWICYPQATFGTRLPPANQLTCTRYKFPFSEYGETWIAYRRPLKED